MFFVFCLCLQDNQKSTIDDTVYERDNTRNIAKDGADCRSEFCLDLEANSDNSSQQLSPSNRSERLLGITNINQEPTPKSTAELSAKKIHKGPKSMYRKIYHNPSDKFNEFTSSSRSSGRTIQLVMGSTSHIDSCGQNSQNSIAKIEVKSTVQREYQLLAQKFHQYTINCRTTIRTLEKKLKKLIDDKHALLHGMVSLRKGQKDVIKKYRKIFNDAMNVRWNYSVLRLIIAVLTTIFISRSTVTKSMLYWPTIKSFVIIICSCYSMIHRSMIKIEMTKLLVFPIPVTTVVEVFVL